jgi:putative salt-induced outer membrane protein YdiY
LIRRGFWRQTLIPAVVVALLLIPSLGARAAIVNSLRGFSEDEPGWSGSIAGSYGASGGNTRESTFAGDGRLQLRTTANIWRLIARGKRTTTRGIETARSTLGHLRHNYLLSERWATIAFLQHQRNPFQRLDSRYLLGFGGRWLAVKGNATRIHLGAAHMFEQESIQDEPGHVKDQRLSTYISLVTELREGVAVDFLVFYQPLWKDFADWRVHGEIKLTVDLTGSLALFTGYNLEHDTRPPDGVVETDWDTKTGFTFSF